MSSQPHRRFHRMPRHRFPRCESTHKFRYPERNDATQAIIAARRMRTHADLSGGDCTNYVDRSYRCRHCNGWHLTSKPLRIARCAQPSYPHRTTALAIATTHHQTYHCTHCQQWHLVLRVPRQPMLTSHVTAIVAAATHRPAA